MFSLELVTSLFKTIASAHTAAAASRINSFAIIDEDLDITDPKLGRTYEDAQKGYYWTRRGVTRNNLEAQYGTLAVKYLNSEGDPEDKHVTDNYELLVAFPLVCNNCDQQMTIFELDALCNKVLSNVIFQSLNSFSVYYGDGDEKVIMADTYAESLDPVPEIADNVIENLVYGDLRYDNIPMRYDNVRFVKTQFSVMVCNQALEVFDYVSTVTQRVGGVTKCANCL